MVGAANPHPKTSTNHLSAGPPPVHLQGRGQQRVQRARVARPHHRRGGRAEDETHAAQRVGAALAGPEPNAAGLQVPGTHRAERQGKAGEWLLLCRDEVLTEDHTL